MPGCNVTYLKSILLLPLLFSCSSKGEFKKTVFAMDTSISCAAEAEKEEDGCSGAPAQAEKEVECRHAPEKEAECLDHSPEEEAECPYSPEASSSEG